ncbi:MAG: helix-turn-helix domain-containing protein [Oscillospiraceae bacterium]
MIEKILELMRENGYSATDLCKKLGLSTSAVYDWKSGKAKPTVSHIKAISELFKVSADYLLFDDIGIETKSQTVANSFNNNKHSTITIQNGSTHTRELTELESELMKITSELPTKEKIKLVDYAYQLIEKKGE